MACELSQSQNQFLSPRPPAPHCNTLSLNPYAEFLLRRCVWICSGQGTGSSRPFKWKGLTGRRLAAIQLYHLSFSELVQIRELSAWAPGCSSRSDRSRDYSKLRMCYHLQQAILLAGLVGKVTNWLKGVLVLIILNIYISEAKRTT